MMGRGLANASPCAFVRGEGRAGVHVPWRPASAPVAQAFTLKKPIFSMCRGYLREDRLTGLKERL